MGVKIAGAEIAAAIATNSAASKRHATRIVLIIDPPR
jgi:hypothetical protein